MTDEAKHGVSDLLMAIGDLLMAIVWLGIGFITGIGVIEHYAPKHPEVFCDDGRSPQLIECSEVLSHVDRLARLRRPLQVVSCNFNSALSAFTLSPSQS